MRSKPVNVDGTGKSHEPPDDESANAVQGRGGHGIARKSSSAQAARSGGGT